MLIHLTLHDNDFTEKLEAFAKTVARCSFNSATPPNYALCITNEQSMCQFGKTTFAQSTPEQRKVYLAIIQKSWQNYIAGAKDEKYLSEKFQAKIVKSIPDEWDNGESVYIVPASYSGCIVTL